MRDPLLLLLATTAAALTLPGCPTVDLGETPPDPPTCNADGLYYEQTIWPQYLAPAETATSCVGQAGCHRLEDGRSGLRLHTDPVDHEANLQIVVRFLNCGSPDLSSLLTKPISGVDSHGGGDLFAPGSAQETTFLSWPFQ